MPLDLTQATNETWYATDGDLTVSWDSPAPSGTAFQCYVDGVLSWAGVAHSCVVPMPPAGGRFYVDVGSVGPGEEHVDFSATLPPPPWGGDRARLTWYGGRWESEDVVGFRVYGAAFPGGPVDYAAPLGTVAALPGGRPADGFGVGPFGEGGFGRSAQTYVWLSPHLGNGARDFAVVAYDTAGEASAPWLTTVALVAPPQPPARNTAGLRLTYTYDKPTRTVTLAWLPSPG